MKQYESGSENQINRELFIEDKLNAERNRLEKEGHSPDYINNYLSDERDYYNNNEDLNWSDSSQNTYEPTRGEKIWDRFNNPTQGDYFMSETLGMASDKVGAFNETGYGAGAVGATKEFGKGIVKDVPQRLAEQYPSAGQQLQDLQTQMNLQEGRNVEYDPHEDGGSSGNSKEQRWDEFPDNDGFVKGTEKSNDQLQTGDKFVRWGESDMHPDYHTKNQLGRYAAPEGTQYGEISLKGGEEDRIKYEFEAQNPVEVTSGTAAPFYGQEGGGTQYKFNEPIDTLWEKGDVKPTSVSFEVDHRNPNDNVGSPEDIEKYRHANTDSDGDLNSDASEENTHDETKDGNNKKDEEVGEDFNNNDEKKQLENTEHSPAETEETPLAEKDEISPAETEEVPPAETEQPQEDSEQPQEESEQPQDDTEQPQEEPEQPQDETEQPQNDNKQSQEETEQPQDDTEQPQEESEQLQDNNEQPQEEPEQLQDDNEQPQEEPEQQQDDNEQPQEEPVQLQDDSEQPQEESEQPQDDNVDDGGDSNVNDNGDSGAGDSGDSNVGDSDVGDSGDSGSSDSFDSGGGDSGGADFSGGGDVGE